MDLDKHYFIIAGSTLQYNFVQKVKENGFIVHIFDFDENCRCREIADYFHCISIDKKEEILEIAKKYNPVAVTTVACEVANVSACYVAQKLNLNTNSYKVSLDTTDKTRMKKIYKKYNIPNAKSYEITSLNDIDIDNIAYPVVVKPADRSAGRGVTLVRKKENFKEIFNQALDVSNNKKVLVEELLIGSQYSIETISCNAKHQIVAFTEEYMDGSDDFIENQQLVPARLKENDAQELEELVFRVLNAFNIKYGCCHIEVKRTNEGFKVIEIASRMGGWRDVLIKYAYNDDYNKMLLDSTLGIMPIIKHEENNYALVKLIFKKQEYEFYSELKKKYPKVIVYDEVKAYTDNMAKNLSEAKGFYYISVPKTENIDYYIQGTILNEQYLHHSGNVCKSLRRY